MRRQWVRFQFALVRWVEMTLGAGRRPKVEPPNPEDSQYLRLVDALHRRGREMESPDSRSSRSGEERP